MAKYVVYYRFEDKFYAAQSDSKKRQTQLLDRGTGRGLVTPGIVRKSFQTKPVAGRPHKPPSNDIHSSSFNNSRYTDRATESDIPPPFRNFSTGCVSPVPGSQLSASHPMLDRSTKGPYCPTNKQLNTEIMKKPLR